MPRARLPLLALAALSFTACAADAPPPAAPAVPVPSSFTLEPRSGVLSDVDAEMMKIARSEEDIDRVFPRSREEKETRRAPADAPKADSVPASGGDPCSTACSALVSMRSSAEHLCKLAGETDGRCDDARGRVRGASSRVRSACPACSAAAAEPGK
jgi:hypothetical protein